MTNAEEVPDSYRFREGDPRTIELARKGGRVKAALSRKSLQPFTGSILDVMDAAGLSGPSWDAWRAFWRSVFGLEMSEQDRETFTRHTGRASPPPGQVSETWQVIGRRAGKSRGAALAAVFLGIRFDPSTLAPGETAVIPIVAADRRQARSVLNYLKATFELPAFKPFHHRNLRESVELHNSITIEVSTASYRTIRGTTVIAAILDEVAFWQVEGSSPDSEVVSAVRPAMSTVPNSLLVALSSPYSAKGELFKAHERSWGVEDPHALVWNADSRSMNPTLPESVVERAFADDPVSAASEYGRDGHVVFRRDVESFLDPMAISAVTVPGRFELPPASAIAYVAFCDPSGGSQDSFTIAIAHSEGEKAVLDLVREVRPPFDPDSVVEQFADLLTRYGICEVVGDRYGGVWPASRFEAHGVEYVPSQNPKSAIYSELLPLVNSGRVELLDLPTLRAQLIALERRTARGGRDSIDHGPGGRDDVANAVAGALTLVESGASEGGFEGWAYLPGFGRVDLAKSFERGGLRR